MTQKGKCLNCKFCYIHDGDDERQLYCLQTKRGRLLTWTMHTGEVRNGVFIPDSTEKLDKRLKDYMRNRIPPKWCIYRKQK